MVQKAYTNVHNGCLLDKADIGSKMQIGGSSTLKNRDQIENLPLKMQWESQAWPTRTPYI